MRITEPSSRVRFGACTSSDLSSGYRHLKTEGPAQVVSKPLQGPTPFSSTLYLIARARQK